MTVQVRVEVGLWGLEVAVIGWWLRDGTRLVNRNRYLFHLIQFCPLYRVLRVH